MQRRTFESGSTVVAVQRRGTGAVLAKTDKNSRNLWLACLLLPAVLACSPRLTHAQNVSLLKDASVATYFSPNGGAVQARVDLIDTAKTRVLLAGYGFTSDAIAQALINAHKRGVKVQVVIDKSNVHSRHSKGMNLQAAGIDVRSHHAYAIMHHKFVVVDDKVAFGSMNATDAGEARNAENWNVFSNAGPLARVYTKEFERLYAGGRAFEDQSIATKSRRTTEDLPASNIAPVKAAQKNDV